MPVVNANSPPYEPYGSVAPASSAPDAYQRISPSPSAFGAAPAASMELLGRTAEQAGDRLATVAIQRQELFNQVAADDATNKYQDQVTKILRGDPAVSGDLGLMGMHGEDALRAMPIVRNKLLEARETLRGSLQNARQQIQFDAETRRQQAFALDRAGEHYDREFDTWSHKVNTAKIENGITGAGTSLMVGDDAEAERQLGRSMVAAKQELDRQGLGNSPDAVNAKMQELRGKFVKMKVEALAQKNPLAAVEYLKNNVDALSGDEGNVLMNHYRTRAAAVQAQIDAGLVAPMGPKVDRGGARTGPANVERFLDLAELHESHGQDIEQGLVPPGGGYNPSTGTVTGPSTASGFFQITDSTWKDNAAKAGVDLDKYPRALGAPYKEQRQVARYIAMNSGVQHWTNWNSALASAVSAEGLPTQGPLKGGAVPQVQNAAAGPDQLIPQFKFPMPPLEQGELPDTQVPGMAEALKQIQKNVPADEPVRAMAAIKAARAQLNMVYQDQQRQLKMHKEQTKLVSNKQEDQFTARIYPGSTNMPTLEEVAKDPYMDGQAKRTISAFLTRSEMADPAATVSKGNVLELYRRMTLPYGTEGKITSEQPVKDAYIAQQISRADHDWAIKQFRDERAPGDETLKTLKDREFKANEARVKGPMVSGVGDPLDAGRRYFNYIDAVNHKIDDFRAANKNPMDLFSPKSPDYVGSDEFLKPFQPNTKDLAGGKDHPLDLSKMDAAKTEEALRNGRISVPQAIKRLEELGVPHKGATSEGPQVPVR